MKNCQDCSRHSEEGEALSFDGFPVLSPAHHTYGNLDDNKNADMRLLKKHNNPTDPPTSAPTMAPTMAPTNSTDIEAEIKKAIDNVAPKSGLGWFAWSLLLVLGSFVVFKTYKCYVRRRRILRSELAGDMLGDLQMVPSDDLSDHGAYLDSDEDDEHQQDNHVGGYRDAHEDHGLEDGVKPIQIV